mmetsp:Transcript_17186/g.23617  ORF Transcript_17186/g.23617 Transcript_17186/m.23617 type:complete len:108 (+) Transcript_17186:11-334(+)
MIAHIMQEVQSIWQILELQAWAYEYSDKINYSFDGRLLKTMLCGVGLPPYGERHVNEEEDNSHCEKQGNEVEGAGAVAGREAVCRQRGPAKAFGLLLFDILVLRVRN